MQAARRFIPSLVVFLIRTLALTFRWRVVDHGGMTRDMRHPIIAIFWHNRLLAMPLLYERFCPARRGSCLTSPSKDGAIIAGVMSRFNIGNVRGSSSRRGATALRELTAVLAGGGDVGITPDGPRGPKYRAQLGAIKLAQLTGVPLLPIHVEYSRYWEVKSWDAFRIPKPFARVEVVFGPLYKVPAALSDEELEAERLRLETELNASVQGVAVNPPAQPA